MEDKLDYNEFKNEIDKLADEKLIIINEYIEK